jgi:chemotaxis signal transduction protein
METHLTPNDEGEGWCYVVTFALDQQTYAVPIESVIKISEISSLTPVVSADATITGMVEIAGYSIPVVNLRRQDVPAKHQVDPHTPVLTVLIGDLIVAMIVDKIAGVLRLPANQVARSAKGLPGTIMDTPRGNAVLLSLSNLFTAKQIKALEQCAPVISKDGRSGLKGL